MASSLWKIVSSCLAIIFVLLINISVHVGKTIAHADLIVDKNRFRYYQWPFTFSGLTVGKPIDNMDLLPYLYPDHPHDIRNHVNQFLKKYTELQEESWMISKTRNSVYLQLYMKKQASVPPSLMKG